MFKRAILVTGFNRPDLLKFVLKKLSAAECVNVFIAIDGPRLSVSDDLDKVLACRELASGFNKANPERNRFLKSNLGCGLAMSSALDWFFKRVDSGIVLEDDIDFSSSFLETMDYLLSTLKDNAQIGSITGLNPISTLLPIDFFDHENSYISHNFFSSWGWATWRDRWQMYEFDLNRVSSNISSFELIRKLGFLGWRFFTKKFDAVREGRVNTWDYQFLAMQLKYNLKCVAPIENQITNMGFRSDATHTKSAQDALEIIESKSKLQRDCMPKILHSKRIDRLYLTKHYKVPTLRQSLRQACNSRYLRYKT